MFIHLKQLIVTKFVRHFVRLCDSQA